MSRTLALAYGTLAYVWFLGSFLYAIGFVANLLVPKSIDTGTVGPVPLAIAINAGLLGLFAVQHSIMARHWFKRWWTRIVPRAIERSTFVLATSAILTLMYWLWRPIPGVVWSVDDPTTAKALMVMSGLGWGLVLISTFLIDHFDLFGLKQVIRYYRRAEHRDPAFKVASIYKYIRHPLYLGFIVAFWATPVMTWGHLLFAVATTGFMLVAVRFEEADLIRTFGEKYRQYRGKVPMLLPLRGRQY
jgi:protein-S-isoprenylcysteine O-methyltransferase Ste14